MAGIVVRLGRRGCNSSLLQWADNEARRSGERLTLLNLWNEPLDISLEIPADVLPDVTVAVTCRTCPPSLEVELLRDDPTLVVLPGAGGLDRRGRSVMEHARCPVVLVPETLKSPRGRIAVGVCGTNASLVAFKYAAALADSVSSELIVVHAWQRPFRSHHQSLTTGESVDTYRHDLVSPTPDWNGLTTGSSCVQLRHVEGPPMEVLLEAADDADVMVLGRHLHNHLARIWHGALAVDVSRHSACPVMVVPS